MENESLGEKKPRLIGQGFICEALTLERDSRKLQQQRIHCFLVELALELVDSFEIEIPQESENALNMRTKMLALCMSM